MSGISPRPGKTISERLSSLNRWPGAWGLLLIIAALLYLLTLDNGLRPDELTGGDLITHQYAQVEARLSNAPGYPLYTMGGWLWFRLGRVLLGWLLNPLQILSFYSTLWGLASLFVLYLILLKVTLKQRLVALLLTVFYATTYFFWYYSVTTEQYTSAVFQTLLIIYLAFRWDEQPRETTLLWLAFISGTMLANMVTTLFILPPLLWFIFFRTEPTGTGERFMLFDYLKRPKLILQAIGLALLPTLSYAYVYIRGAQHPEWQGTGEWSSTWQWFVQFLTIQQGRDELSPGLSLANLFTGEFPSLMWQHELTWLVFFGGLLGLAFLGRRRAVFLYSTLLIYFVFSWGYRFGNWFQVIMPAYPIFVIGFAAGLRRIGEWANERMSKADRRSLAAGRYAVGIYAVIVIFLAGLVIYRFSTSLPRANQHNQPEDTGLNAGWAILADEPVAPALVSGDFEEQVALDYLTTIWQAAPNIYPTEAGELKLPEDKQDAFQVYISRKALAAAPEAIQFGRNHLQAFGQQLIEVKHQPDTQLPATAKPIHINFGHKLDLIGWEQIKTDDPLPEDVAGQLGRATWQIALYWRAAGPIAEDFTISVRPLVAGQLITVNGENLIQDHQPVWGAYPTSRWTPGEVVRDMYALSLPPNLTPEAVQVVIYQVTGTGFENLGEATFRVMVTEETGQDQAKRP